MKKKKIEKSVDEIREEILHFFYDRHKNASSPKRVRLKISEAKSALKELGISGKEAVSNIEYLIDGGWLNKEVEEKEFTTPKGVKIPQKTAQYKASNNTIDYFDKGESIFKKQDTSGINITNIQGVTNVITGDGNTVTVNSKFQNLYSKLDKLSQKIRGSDMDDKEKLNHVAEIGTIKAQLQKPQPDKSIIKRAWNNIKSLAISADTIATTYKAIEALIKVFL